jgi:hypothetical protein
MEDCGDGYNNYVDDGEDENLISLFELLVYSFLCFRIQNDRKTVKMLLQFFQQRSM